MKNSILKKPKMKLSAAVNASVVFYIAGTKINGI